MFKFRKVRGPEEISEAIVTLEESANRLEGMVESAQKEKSRLHLLVGNVSDKVNQMKETAASFEKTAERVAEYERKLKDIRSQIESMKNDLTGLGNLKTESDKLQKQLQQLAGESAVLKAELVNIHELFDEIDGLKNKAEATKAEIEPQIEQTQKRQQELQRMYDDFLNRLGQAESEITRISTMAEKFQQSAEEISRESARITTWMAATEKMAEDLAKTTELFETASSKIDRLHELSEFVESKTKTLNRQKELLKNAHIEYGKANVLFLEIKSKLSEMEADWEQIKQIQTDSIRFENQVRAIESRIGQIEAYSEKLDRLACEFSSLDDKAETLEKFQKQLNQFSETAATLESKSAQAENNLKKIETAIETGARLLNQAESSQKDANALAQHLELLLENGENFLAKIPDINKIQDDIDSVRQKALSLENKILENMAAVTELKNYSQTAADVKERLDSYQNEVSKLISANRKEIDGLESTMLGLKTNLESLRSRWLEMPDILARLAETDKMSAELHKKYSILLERENEVIRLKNLIEQNSESFKKFDNTVNRVHQKASELLAFKADLESVELKLSAVDLKAKTLISLGEKIDQIENRIEHLADDSTQVEGRIKECHGKLSEMSSELAAMRKSQEDLRLDVGEVIDSFGKLESSRAYAEQKSQEFADHCEKLSGKVNQLMLLNEKWNSQSDEIRRTLGELKHQADLLADENHGLSAKFAMLDTESEKIIALANNIKSRQSQLADLDNRITIIEKRLKDAAELDFKLAEFERTFEKTVGWMQSISEKLAAVSKLEDKIDKMNDRLAELDSLTGNIAGKAADIEKMTKQLNRISLIEKELKAKEGTLLSEQALIDKAISACQRLEELLAKAEYLGRKIN